MLLSLDMKDTHDRERCNPTNNHRKKYVHMALPTLANASTLDRSRIHALLLIIQSSNLTFGRFTVTDWIED